MHRYLLTPILTLCCCWLNAQDSAATFSTDSFCLANAEKSKIDIYDTLGWNIFANKLYYCCESDSASANIVHIGDSHLQADFFSGELRRCLHKSFNQTPPSRGLIFPYAMAGTNNPFNYDIVWTGEWTSSKAIDKKTSNLGLAAIEISTCDSSATICLNVRDKDLPGYGGDKLQMFFNSDFEGNCLTPKIIYPDNAKIIGTDSASHAIIWDLNTYTDSVAIGFDNVSNRHPKFTLQGIRLFSGKGIEYNTVGINGARVASYLKCNCFVPQLAVLNADLVIISLGTNDSYGQRFDSSKFVHQLELLIDNVRQANHNSTILLTTPGNNKIHCETYNLNAQICANAICETARRQKCAVWDFNAIMGNLENTDIWYNAGLLRADFLHLTRKGYEYQAHLLFDAMISSFKSAANGASEF